MIIKEYQDFQKSYDKSGYVDYNGHNNKDGKLIHISLHLGIANGKIAEYSKNPNSPDKLEIIKTQVLPDLLFYSLQSSNLFNLNLSKTYFRLKRSNPLISSYTMSELQEHQLKKDAKDKIFEGEKTIKGKVMIIRDLLSIGLVPYYRYMERRNHGEDISAKDLKEISIPALFISSLRLANVTDTILETAYLNRIKSNKERIDAQRRLI